MKHIKLTSALFSILLAATASTFAQTAVETTTTTTNTPGVISEFGPDVLVIKSETATAPIRYTYTTKTIYVDEAGAPVTMTTVKSGLPVTVYYTKDGDKMVASRVVVRKAVVVAPVAPVIEEKKTTTTTTTTNGK